MEIVDLSEDDGTEQLQSVSGAPELAAIGQTSESVQLDETYSRLEEATRNDRAHLTHPPSHTTQPLQEASTPASKFYIEFIATIESSFPWKWFGSLHGLSDSQLRHIFFVLVTLPLANPDESTRSFRLDEGARIRIAQCKRAWEETVANVRSKCSRTELEEEQKAPLRLRATQAPLFGRSAQKEQKTKGTESDSGSC